MRQAICVKRAYAVDHCAESQKVQSRARNAVRQSQRLYAHAEQSVLVRPVHKEESQKAEAGRNREKRLQEDSCEEHVDETCEAEGRIPDRHLDTQVCLCLGESCCAVFHCFKRRVFLHAVQNVEGIKSVHQRIQDYLGEQNKPGVVQNSTFTPDRDVRVHDDSVGDDDYKVRVDELGLY